MKRRGGAWGWGAFLCWSGLMLVGEGCDRLDEHELRPPFVLNHTRFALPVEVSARFHGSCDRVDDGAASEPTPAALPAPIRLQLEPGELIELGRHGRDPATVDDAERCGEALIRVQAFSVHVTWPAGIGEPITERVDGTDRDTGVGHAVWRLPPRAAWVLERGVAIEGAPGVLQFEVGERLEREDGP